MIHRRGQTSNLLSCDFPPIIDGGLNALLAVCNTLASVCSSQARQALHVDSFTHARGCFATAPTRPGRAANFEASVAQIQALAQLACCIASSHRARGASICETAVAQFSICETAVAR